MFGGSGGIVVVSSCLDGPRVHRPADSAWMEARVDSAWMEACADSRQVTGAGTTKLAATDVPGGARPGRITVRAALARGARTLERKSSTRRAVGLLQSKDRRGRSNRTRTRWTLRQSCSKGEGRARVDSRGVREECHAGEQWIVYSGVGTSKWLRGPGRD